MFLLLIACGGVYLLLGSKEDAFILLSAVLIIMVMNFTQERKSERTLEALRDLSSPRALVLRDGQTTRIAGRDVVPGDIIMLSEGDRVPADAVLFSGMSMTVDESLLSGESVPVRKQALPVLPTSMATPGGNDQPYLYSGTLVVQGKGKALVIATAKKTALGRIGQALYSEPEEASKVQTETAHAVKVVAWFSLVLVILLTVWYGVTRHDWLNGILAGLTLAMAILPAELPLILAIFLGLGAWRIAKSHVLTRRTYAIEMLGSATVLCVDKTGTLTQNSMTVAQIMVDGEVISFQDDSKSKAPLTVQTFPEKFHETLEFVILASHRDPFDPMEKAIQAAGVAVLSGTEHIHLNWTLEEEYPLSPELLAMSRVWKSPDLAHYVIATKGAPEAIIDLCHLNSPQKDTLTAQINQLAEQGLRVLAVAKADFHKTELPPIQHDFNFNFLGLIALADPLRPTAKAAIAQCHTAGLRVVMITGDLPATALNIARQSGLDTSGGVITGPELDQLDPAQLREAQQRVNVFCRIQPEQKLHLVTAFKEAGGIVAMTGDGVNDAPALKAAHIGIAMGGRGTDVARESAALVLLNDDFGAIVAAIRLGRRIFDNIRKAVVFVIAVHIPIAGMSLLPVFMGWPLILLPIHIVFLELMIGPTCSIVFEAEPEESNVMQRPPRPTDAKIFGRALFLKSIKQGLLLFGLQVVIYLFAQRAGFSVEQIRMMTFSVMILSAICLIFINRSWTLPMRASFKIPNPTLWAVVIGTLLMLALALFVPVLNRLFHFSPLV
jgi:Ca2+-transporting ATPase